MNQSTEEAAASAETHVTPIGVGCKEVTPRAPWWKEEGHVYTSTIGVALSLELRAGEVSCNEQELLNGLRRDLRLLGDLAADLGALCPIIGVVTVPGESRCAGWLTNAATDQEWHQGRFSLFVVRSPEGAPALVREQLSPEAATLAPETGRSKSWKDVLNDLDEVSKDLKEPRLVDALKETTSNSPHLEPEDVKTTFEGWMKQHIAQQLGRDVAMHIDSGKRASAAGRSPDLGQPAPIRKRISRVTSLKVEQFRGFREMKGPLNLDADLVLIRGPNGVGKSSLMEALLLALTGHGCRDLGDLQVQQPPGESRPEFKIELEAKSELPDQANQPEQQHDSDLIIEVTDGEQLSIRTGNATWTKFPSDTVPGHWKCTDGRVMPSPGSSIESELQFRTCAYLQDFSDRLFDENARGETLRDLLEPLPPKAKALKDQIKAALASAKNDDPINLIAKIEGFRARIRELEPEQGERKLADLQDQLEPFARIYKDVAREAEKKWPSPPRSALAWQTVATDLAGVLGMDDKDTVLIARTPLEWLLDRLDEETTRQYARQHDASRAAGLESDYEKMRMRLSHVEDELRRLVAGPVPAAERAIRWLSPERSSFESLEESQLTSLFRLLVAFAFRWSGRLPSDREEDGGPPLLPDVETTEITKAVEELALVDIARAQACLTQLRAWEEKHRTVLQQREDLETEQMRLEEEMSKITSADPEILRLRELQEELKTLRRAANSANLRTPFSVWRDYRKWEEEQARRPELERELKAWENLRSDVRELARELDEKLKPSEALRSDLQRETLRVLQRFTLVEGMDKLSLEELSSGDESSKRLQFRPITDDQRSIDHFSTGQRSQVAVAWLIAQRLVADSDARLEYPHKLLLLDDVSTAYDLTNLVREATLWRQLAYHPEANQRLQVVMSSHHDELTSRMLDLLVPPKGCKLHVLSFEGWTKDKGPEINIYYVQEGTTSAELAANLARAWKEAQ